jgi:hypothetical protein
VKQKENPIHDHYLRKPLSHKLAEVDAKEKDAWHEVYELTFRDGENSKQKIRVIAKRELEKNGTI